MSCAKRHFWFGRCATWVVLEVVEIYARSWLAPKHCWCSMLVLVGTCWWCWSTGRHDCGPCRWLVVYREHPCWTISTLHAIGAELGFESMDSGSFTCCGKHIRRAEDHAIRLTMTAYHSNLSEVVIAKHWKSDVDAVFEKHGHKQLHAVLGSLQWLVAQIRYTTCPSAFRLCKAKASNSWNPDSSERCSTWVQTHWWLRIMCSGRLTTCQQAFALFLMQRLETSSWMDLRLELRRDVFTPKHATFCLLCEESMLHGKQGAFNIFDARSHRIPRVCRSMYSAETLAAEEPMDVGQLCRGMIAMIRLKDLTEKEADAASNAVSMTTLVDAKDVHDKGNSDTSSLVLKSPWRLPLHG